MLLPITVKIWVVKVRGIIQIGFVNVKEDLKRKTRLHALTEFGDSITLDNRCYRKKCKNGLTIHQDYIIMFSTYTLWCNWLNINCSDASSLWKIKYLHNICIHIVQWFFVRLQLFKFEVCKIYKTFLIDPNNDIKSVIRVSRC